MSFKCLKDKYGLPDGFKVKVKKTGGLYTAFLPEFPGCITMAKNQMDLIYQVNDAVLTYFKVPREDAIECGIFYLPSQDIPAILKVKSSLNTVQIFNNIANPRLYA